MSSDIEKNWKYEGSDEIVVVPEGVKVLRNSAFYKIDTVKEVILPDGLETVDEYAFIQCNNLEKISFPDHVELLGSYTYECLKLQTLVFRGEDYVLMCRNPQCKRVEISEQGLYSKVNGFSGEVFWQNFPSGVDFFNHDGEHLVTRDELAMQEQKAKEEEEQREKEKEEKAKDKENQKLDAEKKRIAANKNNPLKKEFIAANKWAIKKRLDFSGLSGSPSQEVIDQITFVIYAYAKQLTKEPSYHAETWKTDTVPVAISAEADKVASTIDKKILMEAITLNPPQFVGWGASTKHMTVLHTGEKKEEDCNWYELGIQIKDGGENLALLLPLCRYADSKAIKTLISNADSLVKGVDPIPGRRTAIAIRSGLLLSDTKEAMVYIKKCGLLGLYAEMRGMTKKKVNDMLIADTGLQPDGSVRFDL